MDMLRRLISCRIIIIIIVNTCLYHALPVSALQAEEMHVQARQQSPQTPRQSVYKICIHLFSSFSQNVSITDCTLLHTYIHR